MVSVSIDKQGVLHFSGTVSPEEYSGLKEAKTVNIAGEDRKGSNFRSSTVIHRMKGVSWGAEQVADIKVQVLAVARNFRTLEQAAQARATRHAQFQTRTLAGVSAEALKAEIARRTASTPAAKPVK